MSASAGPKVKRDDIFGSVKRRRTTPPGWTGFQSNSDEYNNHVINGGRIRQEDDDDDDGSEELLGPEEEAQGNLVSLCKSMSIWICLYGKKKPTGGCNLHFDVRRHL